MPLILSTTYPFAHILLAAASAGRVWLFVCVSCWSHTHTEMEMCVNEEEEEGLRNKEKRKANKIVIKNKICQMVGGKEVSVRVWGRREGPQRGGREKKRRK